MVCAPVRRDNPHALSHLYLAYYGVSRVKDWVSADCGTREIIVSLTNVRITSPK